MLHPPSSPAAAATKPRWRGFSHKWSFIFWIPVGIGLVGVQFDGEWVAALVYAICVAAMFGLSALYHRINWSHDLEPSMLQLDKTGIYLMIAGTFTPIAINLDGGRYDLLLLVVWLLTAVLIAGLWVPWAPPFGVITASYIGVGWLGLLALPAMWDQFGPGFVALILVGGVMFTGGAFLLGVRRPRLRPETFGYHEVWHVLVIAGTLIHLVGLIRYVF